MSGSRITKASCNGCNINRPKAEGSARRPRAARKVVKEMDGVS